MRNVLAAILGVMVGVIMAFHVSNYFTRGYYFKYFVFNDFQMGNSIEKELPFGFELQRVDNERVILNFENRSIRTYGIINYRFDSLFYDLKPETLFSQCRIKASYGEFSSEESCGFFDCGTGLGIITINPFDSFVDTMEIKDLFRSFFSYNGFKVDQSDDTLLIKKRYLFTCGNSPFFSFDNSLSLPLRDSLKLQFYLPIYSLISGNEYRVYSEPIFIDSQEVIDNFEKYNYMPDEW